MHRNRVIATVILKNNIVVQSIGFAKYLPVGNLKIALEFLTLWGVDEIVVVDIDASKSMRSICYDLIKESARKCFVPLTVGGGINCLNDAKKLGQSGADKILLNNLLIQNPEEVKNIVRYFGKQFVIASIDVLLNDSGEYCVYDYFNKKPLKTSVESHMNFVQQLGVGEMILNAVHRDGTYSGYDISLYNKFEPFATVPLIAQGGAKNANSMLELFEKTKVKSAAAANYFHFTEHSVNVTKSILHNKNKNVRIESAADYLGAKIDSNMRLNKLEDDVLEKLLFEKIEIEKI